jgi:hypothetical protein
MPDCVYVTVLEILPLSYGTLTNPGQYTRLYTKLMNHDSSPPDIRKATTGYVALQVMTLIRIPMAVAFGLILVYAAEGGLKFFACLALLILIEASDLLDGVFARRYDLVSEYGAMLDPYADSITRLIVYWSMAAHSPWPTPGSPWPRRTAPCPRRGAARSRPCSRP